MTIQAVVATPQFPQVFVFSGAFGVTTTGSVTAPRGATRVTVEAIGGGGAGFGAAATGSRSGGSGGAYARSINLAVTGGVTVVYYQAGRDGTQSWVNVGTNIAPTLSTAGCRASAGNAGASGVAGTAQSGFVGTTSASSAGGTIGASAIGGGAGGAGATIAGAAAAGSGLTGGTDTTGMSLSTQLMGNGNGGAFSIGGTAPGGSGGGSPTTGVNPAGAGGRVRIIFYG